MFRYHAYLAQEIRYKLTAAPFIVIPSMEDAKEGFWVNELHNFTRGEDARFWVPPTQIVFVESLWDYL